MKAKLKDIERELWLRMRNEGKIVWVTKDNKEIPVKDMELPHLINTYNMLLRNAAKEAAQREEQAMLEDAAFGISANDLQL